MNKKLERLLQPGMGWFFVVLLCFSGTTMLMGYHVLGTSELVVTALLFVLYWFLRARRNKEVQAFLKSTFNTLDMTKGAESPFPMALIRLVDGGIIWSNDRFATVTGFREKMHEQRIGDMLPTLTTGPAH